MMFLKRLISLICYEKKLQWSSSIKIYNNTALLVSDNQFPTLLVLDISADNLDLLYQKMMQKMYGGHISYVFSRMSDCFHSAPHHQTEQSISIPHSGR